MAIQRLAWLSLVGIALLLSPLGSSALAPGRGAQAQATCSNFTASLTNSQEVPPVIPTTMGGMPRPASFGTATFTLNAAMTALTFTATISNIEFTGSQTADANDNLIAAHYPSSLRRR